MQIPVGASDLTPSWMTAALRAEGTIGAAAVVAVDVGVVGEVGMTGQIFRVGIRYDDAPAGAPGSVVAKLSGSSPEVRDVVHSRASTHGRSAPIESWHPGARYGCRGATSPLWTRTPVTR